MASYDNEDDHDVSKAELSMSEPVLPTSIEGKHVAHWLSIATLATRLGEHSTMPVPLERLDQLVAGEHTVTWKIDGERRTLVALARKESSGDKDELYGAVYATCYLVRRNGQVHRLRQRGIARSQPTPATLAPDQAIVLDGEMAWAADMAAVREQALSETRALMLSRCPAATTIDEDELIERVSLHMSAVASLETLASAASYFDDQSTRHANALLDCLIGAAVAITRHHGGEIVDARGYAAHFGLAAHNSAVLAVILERRFDLLAKAVDELTRRMDGRRAPRRLVFFVNDCLHNGQHVLGRQAMRKRLEACALLLNAGACAPTARKKGAPGASAAAASSGCVVVSHLAPRFSLEETTPSSLEMRLKPHAPSSVPHIVYHVPTCLIGVRIDGLVLPLLSAPYKCGTDTTLFKMKPRALNTADLMLAPNGRDLLARSSAQAFTVVGHLDDDAIASPGAIYECVLVNDDHVWRICKHRQDKTRPNFIHTVECVVRIHRNHLDYDQALVSLRAH